MNPLVIGLSLVGAASFGVVVGWVTYRSLRRSDKASLTDIAAVVGAVGGAAVTALFPRETGAFGAYCIGLAVGFFGYLLVAAKLPGTSAVAPWLGESPGGAQNTFLGTPPDQQSKKI